jgi:inosine-uridine nucleoside N-ribohydrolase
MEENFSECWIIDTDYTLDDQLAISYLIKHLNVVAITVNAANTGYTPEVIKAKIKMTSSTNMEIQTSKSTLAAIGHL